MEWKQTQDVTVCIDTRLYGCGYRGVVGGMCVHLCIFRYVCMHEYMHVGKFSCTYVRVHTFDTGAAATPEGSAGTSRQGEYACRFAVWLPARRY